MGTEEVEGADKQPKRRGRPPSAETVAKREAEAAEAKPKGKLVVCYVNLGVMKEDYAKIMSQTDVRPDLNKLKLWPGHYYEVTEEFLDGHLASGALRPASRKEAEEYYAEDS